MTAKFTYDPVRKQARSSDPAVYLERVNISKENVYAFCLHWYEKKIIINAKVNVTGVLPETRHDWTIIGVGKINVYIPAYIFSSKAEFLEAATLGLNAMKVMPESLVPNETPIITARYSPELEVLLAA